MYADEELIKLLSDYASEYKESAYNTVDLWRRTAYLQKANKFRCIIDRLQAASTNQTIIETKKESMVETELSYTVFEHGDKVVTVSDDADGIGAITLDFTKYAGQATHIVSVELAEEIAAALMKKVSEHKAAKK